MKVKISLLLVLLLALGWYQTLNLVAGTPIRIKGHMEQARKYEEKEIYEDALEEYQAAVDLGETDGEVKRKIAEMQLYLDDESSFIASCEALVNQKNIDQKALQMLVDYYDSDGKQATIVSLLKKLRGQDAENETVEKLWKKYRGYYEETFNSYDEVTPFYQGYAVMKYEGRFGLSDFEGEVVIPAAYEGVGFLSEEIPVVPVCENKRWYYLNTKIHKKIVPDDSYEYLGVISEDTAVVMKNKKYGYADTEIVPKTELAWDFASNFKHGAAAVKRDGKWALLDASFEMITDYIYEDIAVSESGFCSGMERIFAKTKDGYCLLDTSGKRVGDGIYEDARPFETDALAAVKKNGKWGFVNTSGELVIDCQYDDARSFTQGVAAVKKKDKWGYINASNEMIIKPAFEDAYPFCEKGTAPVKNEYWHFIRLYSIGK